MSPCLPTEGFIITTRLALFVLFYVRPAHPVIYRIPAYVFHNTNTTCSTEVIHQTVQDNITSKLNAALNLFEDNNYPCRAEEGWRRIADVNISDINQVCPQGLTLRTSPFRLCGRSLREATDFCEGTTFSVAGASYSKVCGRIRGYQVNLCYGLREQADLENSYVDGVSLTHGPAGSRQHMWTFITGHNTIGAGISYCPVSVLSLHPFITNDYFCDSGNTPGSIQTNRVFANPLWDGVGCDGDSHTPPRCYVNNPPWFHKVLPRATTDDIELRICGYSTIRWGDTYLQEIELYVK